MSRTITVFGNSFPSLHQKWGVSKITNPQPRKLLITGTGRCGTKNLASRFQKASLDIGHEVCGVAGTSSRYFLVDSDWYPVHITDPDGTDHIGERKSDYIFEHTIHLYRKPTKTIPSIARTLDKLYVQFLIENNILPPESMNIYGVGNNILLASQIYFYVNVYIEENLKPIMRLDIEKFDEPTWKLILSMCGMSQRNYVEGPKNEMIDLTFSAREVKLRHITGETEMMYKKHLMLNDEEILSIDKALNIKITDMMKRYSNE